MGKQPQTEGGAVPPAGTVRTCIPYAGEVARHRVITADGFDYIVATACRSSKGGVYITSAYPVLRGYLVMMRQPLCELRTAEAYAASEQHERLVRALSEAGVKLVRARRALAARHRNEFVLTEDAAAAKAAQGEASALV